MGERTIFTVSFPLNSTEPLTWNVWSWVTCHHPLLLPREVCPVSCCQQEAQFTSRFCYRLSDKAWENKSSPPSLPALIPKQTLSVRHPQPLVTLQIAPSTQFWCLEAPPLDFVPKGPLPPFCYQLFLTDVIWELVNFGEGFVGFLPICLQ